MGAEPRQFSMINEGTQVPHDHAEGNQVVIFDSASQLLHPLEFLRSFFRDVRESSGAVKTLLSRNLALRYRYSSLGLLWAAAPPLVTATALTLGQRMQVISSQDHDVPMAFYAVFGILMAQTFLESLNLMQGLFKSHRQLLTRDNMPLESLILSSFLEECFHTSVRIVVLVLCIIISIKVSRSTFALIFPGFLGLVLAGGGIGLLIAPFNSLKGDLEKVMTVFPWIFFAITPVFVRGGSTGFLHDIFALNPAAWVFDSMRHVAYGAPGSIRASCLILPVGLMLFVIGALWCRLARPYVMERSLS